MAFETFGAGIEPGGLRDSYEIKILICYLLSVVGDRLSMLQINEVFQQDGLVNYFDYIKSIAELKQTGHIRLSEDGEGEQERYVLTELGKSTAQTLERSLPRSVRDKVVSAAMKMLSQIRRESQNKATIRQVEDGYIVNMRMLDIGSDLLALDLFAPDKLQAQAIKQQFLSDPQLFYKGVIALLTGDLKTVGDLIPTDSDQSAL